MYYKKWGSCSCSVGRAVASNSRGPRFESSHRQKIILNIYCLLYWKDENKEKEAENGPFKKHVIKYSMKRQDETKKVIPLMQ